MFQLAKHHLVQVVWIVTFWIGAMLGSIASRLGLMRPTPEQVIRVFGSSVKPRARQIATRIAIVRSKRQLMHVIRPLVRSIPQDGLVRWHGENTLLDLKKSGKPAILMFWHMGGYFITASALYKLRLTVDFLRMDGTVLEVPGLNYHAVKSGDSSDRARAMKTMLNRLRKGGFVCMAIDGGAGDSAPVEATCLGQPIRFRQGIMLLARMSGAPVIPITARWAHASPCVDVECDTPMTFSKELLEDEEAFDREFANSVARLQEEFLRKYPEEISWLRFRKMLRANKKGDQGRKTQFKHRDN